MNANAKKLYASLYTNRPPLVKKRDFGDINVAGNRLIFLFLLLVFAYQLFIAPLLLNISTWFLLSLLPTLLFTSTTGVMVHEAIHGLLHPSPRQNRLMGQVMAVCIGQAYDLQRFDHLLHHRLSRTQNDCDEIYIAKRRSTRKVIKYYYRKLLAAYWHDFILTVCIGFLPSRYIYRIMNGLNGSSMAPDDNSALSITLRNGRLKALRIEGACSLVLLACSAGLYWQHLWVLLTLYLARAFILTVLDSFAHYQTPINDSLFARNVTVPRFFEKVCLLNFNYHGVHHIFPTVPWNKLPGYREYFQPDFYLITHGGLGQSLKEKYKPPRVFSHWPDKWLPGGARQKNSD